MSIAENVASIRARMDAAAVAAGRDPREVSLLAATKMTDADRELVEMANLVFSDGLLTGTKYYGSVCQLSDHELIFGDSKSSAGLFSSK